MDVQKEQEQQNRTDHVVSGFAFYSEKDARLAEQERQKIAYLDKRIDRTNLESVLVIYKKALDDRVFRTPVGLEYLRELQGELKAEQESVGRRDSAYPSVDELCGHQGKNVSCQKKNQTGTGRK